METIATPLRVGFMEYIPFHLWNMCLLLLEHMPSMFLIEPESWQTLKYLLNEYLNLYYST